MQDKVNVGQVLGAMLLLCGMTLMVVSWIMETYNFPDYTTNGKLREACCGGASAIMALALLLCAAG